MPEPRKGRMHEVADNSVRDMRRARKDFFTSGWDEISRSIEPLSSLMVGAEEITITVDLPLVDDKQVKVQVHGVDTVEVYARTRRTVRFDDLGIKHRSGEFTCYHTMMELPEPVDATKVIHCLKRGILEIRLPKLRRE
jgi:HSP20 family molecular chaperone IbpA